VSRRGLRYIFNNILLSLDYILIHRFPLMDFYGLYTPAVNTRFSFLIIIENCNNL